MITSESLIWGLLLFIPMVLVVNGAPIDKNCNPTTVCLNIFCRDNTRGRTINCNFSKDASAFLKWHLNNDTSFTIPHTIQTGGSHDRVTFNYSMLSFGSYEFNIFFEIEDKLSSLSEACRCHHCSCHFSTLLRVEDTSVHEANIELKEPSAKVSLRVSSEKKFDYMKIFQNARNVMRAVLGRHSQFRIK
jgi:hypothetical protein